MKKEHCDCEIEHQKEQVVLNTRDEIALDMLRLLIKKSEGLFLTNREIQLEVYIALAIRALDLADVYLKERNDRNIVRNYIEKKETI